MQRDQAAWDTWVAAQKGDGYGLACFSFAERWADLMEAAIAEGKLLQDVAKQTSHTADTEGITGFMYGMAVSILAKTWVHGEELRRWHNLDWGRHGEGERANAEGTVLNPAIVIIGGVGGATSE